MLKHFAQLLVVFFFVLGAIAEPVTKKEAAAAARAWLSRSGHFGLRSGGSVERVHEFQTSSSNRFFAVKLVSSGTVFLSGDSQSEPIVAFTSSTNDFADLSEESPLGALLRRDADVRANIRAASAANRGALSRLSLRWNRLTELGECLDSSDRVITNKISSIDDVRVAPLLSTRWSQQSAGGHYCYNYYTTNHYPCGCTATATAQLMRYYSYPTKSISTRRPQCQVNGKNVFLKTIGGTFDWDSMVDVPTSANYSDEAWKAIGHLTHDVGVLLKSSYASNGTGAYVFDVPSVLTNTFGYSQAALYECDNVYYEAYYGDGTVSQQIGLHLRANRQNVIAASLDAGLPVELGIYGYPNGYVGVRNKLGGHAVVGDGYGYVSADEDGEDVPYLHINMGWAGSDDAWYNVPEIQTSDTGSSVYDGSYDFTVFCMAVYNVMTNSTGVIVSGRVLDAAGAPRSGVKVTLEGTESETVSNAKGIYSFVVTPKSTVTVNAVGESGKILHSRTVTTGSSASSSSIGNVWGVDLTAGSETKTPDPVFSPASCTFVETTNVTLSCSLATAEIRYTCDGTDPTETSSLYTEPLVLTETVTIKARAYSDECIPSEIVTAEYVYQREPLDLYVDAENGEDVESGGSEDAPYATIQYALSQSVDGDIIYVAPGVYSGPVTSPANFVDIYASGTAEETVIDGNGTDYCYNGCANVTNGIVGFTLRNGVGYNGGGIWGGIAVYCVITNCQAVWSSDLYYEQDQLSGYGGGAAEAQLYNCDIVDCEAYYGGGAASCYLAFSTVRDCTASYCSGGCDYCYVENCLLANCSSSGNGGGASDGRFWNVTIADNVASGYGGGIYFSYANGLVCNTIVADNSSSSGEDYGNDIYANVSFSYDGIFVGSDPGFAADDYRLTARSPCIDIGDNVETLVTVDLDGNPRIVGTTVDLGCYEYQLDSSWTDPGITTNDSASVVTQKINAAMQTEGFSPAIAAAISTPAQYSSMLEWSSAHGVSRADQNASPVAILSPALGADGLLTDYGSSNVVISAISVTNGNWTLTFDLTDYDPAKVDERLLKAAIGIVGSSTVSGKYSSDDLDCTVEAQSDAVRVTVTPPAEAQQYFMKGAVR